MLLVKIGLAPFAFLATALLLMATHVIGTSFYREATWLPTTATVLRAGHLCELTYQPPDRVLRATAAVGPCDTIETVKLPEGGAKARVFDGVYGALAYEVDGASRQWKGKLQDAGVYEAVVGQTFELVYDPSDPDRLDSTARKGWFGGLLLWTGSLAFLVFYGRLVWPGRKPPPSRATAFVSRGPVGRERHGFGPI